MNLGLSGILEPSISKNGETVRAETARPDENSLTEDRPNEFVRLAAASQWEELAKFAEDRFREVGDSDVEARLWWIRAQMSLKSMPNSVLAAPLDSAASSLESQGWSSSESRSLILLAAELLKDMGIQLARVGDARIAMSFLERSYRLGGSSTNELQSLVERERDRIERTSKLKPSNKLGAELTRLTKLQSELQSQHSAPSPASQNPAHQDLVGVNRAIGAPVPFPKKSSGDGLKYLIAMLVLSLTLCTVGLYYWYPTYDLGGEVSSAVSPLAIDVPAVESGPILPSLERIEPGPSTTLSDILATLETEPTKGVDSKAPAAVANPNTNLPKPELAAVLTDTTPKKKEALDLAGPVESENLKRSIEQPATIVSNNPSRAPFSNSDSSATSGRFQIQSPDIVRGDSPHDPIVGGNQYPFGASTTQYVVTTPTSIFSTPSNQGAKLGDLRTSDKVRVLQIQGSWLQIASDREEIGYIPYVHAVPYKPPPS